MGNDLLELAGSLPFIDEIYAQYLQNPGSVDPSWRRLFDEGGARPTNGHVNGEAVALPSSRLPSNDLGVGRIYGLVNAYRVRGHLEAQLDPLDHLPRERHSDLDYRTYGFTEADLQRVMPSGGFVGIDEAPLGELLRRLRATYCGAIGVEMMHITATEKRTWLQQRLEPTLSVQSLDHDSRVYISSASPRRAVRELCAHQVCRHQALLAGRRGVADSLLELVIERAGLQGVEEVVLGMAHRGRLNVLANVMGRSRRRPSPSSRTSTPSRCSAAVM